MKTELTPDEIRAIENIREQASLFEDLFDKLYEATKGASEKCPVLVGSMIFTKRFSVFENDTTTTFYANMMTQKAVAYLLDAMSELDGKFDKLAKAVTASKAAKPAKSGKGAR